MELSPSPTNWSKDSWKLLPLHISMNWPSFGDLFRVRIIASHFGNCEMNSSYGNCEVVNHGKNAKENLIDSH